MIAGVDEAGRGAWFGEVTAAAVILPEDYDLPLLGDSKKLSASQRETLAHNIQTQALAWAIGSASAAEIDQLNIHHATLLAMQRALEALSIKPEHALIDGKFVPNMPLSCTNVIDGDAKIPAISAASILAKVHRDALMQITHQQHPEYGFAQHKGYGTKQHQQALQRHGILPAHRRSYAPIKRLLAQA